jgi:glycosyltransferase 2 family protein
LLGRIRSRFRDLTRPVPDEKGRRRPGDAVRVVIAAVLLVVLALHANEPFAAERTFGRFLRSLPHDADTFILLFYDLLALWAVALLAFALVLLRRWRLARDVGVAGALAWVMGRLVAGYVEHTDLRHAFTVTFDLTDVPRFPLVRVGIAVAVVAVASPYLARPTRRIGQAIVVLLALASMYLAPSLPTDVLGAIVLGWGVAALVHFMFGTAARRPTIEQVSRALADLGVAATNVRPGASQPLGRAVFIADGDDGEVRVVAIGRDEADAQFMARLWRWIAFRDAPPTLFPTRRQQVEYEAYTMLLAQSHGTRVPAVVVAAASGSLALLVEQNVDGTPVVEAAIPDAWEQTRALHSARIAHGRLDADHLVQCNGAVTVVGWEWASTAARQRPLDADVAQLLATTSAIVGPERAVDFAVAGVGKERLAAALPLLQSNALSGTTRDALDDARDRAREHAPETPDPLLELRQRAAAAVGVEPPELHELYRVNPRRLLMAVAALVAIAVLLSRVGDPVAFWETIRDASWGYVLLALALGILTDVAFAVAFLGTVPVRIPLWPAIELQSSMSFSNLAVPVAADAAIQIRFLQKFGLDLASAVAIGGVFSSVSEIFVQVVLFGVALWLSPDSINFGRIDTNQIVVLVLIVIFVVGVAAGVVFGVRRIRHAVVPHIVRAATSVWNAMKSPSRVALLLGGNIAANCLYAASLLACLHAFGASVDFWTLLAMNIGISLIASLVPFPGGGTAVSAVGLTGLLHAVGVPTAEATAAVIAHQLAVSYLPAIPGWFTTNDLVRKQLL